MQPPKIDFRFLFYTPKKHMIEEKTPFFVLLLDLQTHMERITELVS